MNKLHFLLLVLATGCFAVFTKAQPISTTKQYVLGNTPNTTVVFEPSPVVYSQVQTQNGTEFILSVDKGTPLLEKGAPHLSKLTASVVISESGMYRPVVVDSVFTDYANVSLAPDKGNLYRNQDPSQIPFWYGPQYQTNAFYPANLAELRQPYVLRDVRGVTVVAYPMQYNPVTKVLRVYSKLVVELVETHQTTVNQLQKPKNAALNHEFNQIYGRQFLNYTESKYTPVAESGKLLIICHPNYADAMAPLVEWKRQRGLATELVEYSAATTGTSASSLKTYVTNYYNANSHSFLLLVGDAEQIPSLNQSGDSDVAYSYVSGSDSYPEFFVGRFSAQSVADVETQVARTIFYEKLMGTEATWLATATGIASAEGAKGSGDDGESDIQHMNNIRTDLTGYGYTTVDQIYDPGASATTVANAVNSGRGVMNYVGHGADTYWVTTNFGVSHVNQLTNENKQPFIFDVACVNGNFHGQTCFAEAWLRAQKNGNPTGAVAIIASTINQSWSPPMDGQDEMNDILVESYQNNKKRTFGGIVYNGCMHMNDAYGSGGDEMTNTWTTFGDPSLLVRTKAPQIMTINHDNEILIGNNSLSVTCDADGALACLSKEGQILATGTLSGGSVTLSFNPFTDVGTCQLVVTGYNKKTYTAAVSVIPAAGPFVSVQGFSIDDDQNHQVENGETFNIDVALKNVGIEIANNTTVTLTSNDTNLTIANTAYNFGSIGIGGSVSGGQFTAKVKYYLPDQYLAKFTINVVCGTLTWQKQVSIKVNAPKITASSASIVEDGTFGNGNGRIDPGETGFISVQVVNNGTAIADSAAIYLEALSVYLTQDRPNGVIESLGIGASDTVLFKIKAHAATPQGTGINGNADTYCNDTSRLEFSLVIGQKPEITLGTGTTQVENYPFNNYYEDNKSQILYLSSELGASPVTITAIEFDFKTVTQTVTKRDLKDFTIKMGYSSLNQITGSYATLTNETPVYFESTFMIPASTGWFRFDITDFDYNPASGNLVIEIFWGDNGEYCASTDRTYLNGTSTTFSSVVYGTSDTQTPPSYSGASNLRPNTRFVTASEASQIQNVELIVKSGNSGVPVEGAVVTIGSMTQTTTALGVVNFELANGNYDVQASSELFFDYTGTIIVDESNTHFELNLTSVGPTHAIEFTVTDGTNAVPNAKVVFYGKTLYSGSNGKVLYASVPEGERVYSVSKEGYYSTQGSFDIVSDSNIALQINKIPVYKVEFTVTEKGNPLEGASISFKGLISETNSTGLCAFNEIQIGQNLIFIVTKSGYYTVTDTFDLVDADKTINVELSQIPDVMVQVSHQGGKLKGASVSFQSQNLVTSDSGLVSFVDVSILQNQVVKITKSGYYSLTDTLNVPENDTLLAVYLRKITDLSITVLSNGVAVQGASVTINGMVRLSDSQGIVKFTDLPAAANVVCTVQYAGYYTLTDTFDVTFDDLRKQYSILQIPDAQITVTDGSLPIKNAKITMNNLIINTNSEGVAVFVDLQQGEYPYSIEKAGFYSYIDTLIVGHSDIVQQAVMKAVPDLKFVITSNNLPLPGAQVFMNNQIKTVNTSGECTFIDVPAGKTTFVVKKDKYVDYTAEVTVADTDTTLNIELALVKYKVKFEVTSETEKVAGAVVIIGENNYETDQQGVVELSLPILDSYQYKVEKEGYYSNSGSFSVVDADVVEPVKLDKITYSVRFNIVFNDAPLALAEVTFNNETKTTGIDGIVEFYTILPNIKIPLIVNGVGFEHLEREIMIESDSSFTISLNQTGAEANQTSKIMIYPNPARDQVNVKTNVEILNLEWFDANGKLIQALKPEIGKTLINIPLPEHNGLLILKLQTQNGVLVEQIMVDN